MSRRGLMTCGAFCLATAGSLALIPMGTNALVAVVVWLVASAALVLLAVQVDEVLVRRKRHAIRTCSFCRGSQLYRTEHPAKRSDRWGEKVQARR